MLRLKSCRVCCWDALWKCCGKAIGVSEHMQKATAKLNSIIAAHQLQSSRIADLSTQLAVDNCVALHMRVCGVYGVWCVCAYVCVSVCMCAYCACVCLHICASVLYSMFINCCCMNQCACACVWVCVCASVYLCTYLCLCVKTHMYDYMLLGQRFSPRWHLDV